MNKKVLGIVIAVIVLTLGAVFVMNYTESPKEEDLTSDNEMQEDIIDEDTVPSEGVEDLEDLEEDTDIEAEEPIEVTEVAMGELAPDFKLENLDGEEVSLSDYRGKIVLINFWATWCKFCDIEMPDLNDINDENEDVVVLAVNVREEQPKVKKYIEEGGYDFDVVLDTTGEISQNYLISSFPTTYAVDPEGILLGGVPGMLTKPQMEQIVESARTEE